MELWRIHDLRRTVNTRLRALGVDSTVVNKLLDHKLPGMEAVYDRHDYISEKRAALEKWAQHIIALDAKLR